MNTRTLSFAAVAIASAAVFSLAVRSQGPGAQQPPGGSSDADREAIQKSARDFAEAFNKGDAKAVAALWTENGECREANGPTFVGRAAIEKSYAEFFKANPGAKIEVLVKSIRFPAKDLA